MTKRWMARKPSADKAATALCWLVLACNPGKPRSSATDAAPLTPALTAMPTATAAPPPSESPADDAAAGCPRYRAPVARGTLHEAQLSELSGLSASVDVSGLFWVHNDSGDEARIYALSSQATWLATFRLPGVAKPKDVEDIALVRTAGRSRIYLGDIGDNERRRTGGIVVHRIDEPHVKRSGATLPPNREQSTGKVVSMTLHYSDGPQDAEALLVDPRSETLVIVTKAFFGAPRVYFKENLLNESPLTLAGEMTEDITGAPLHLVTAADVSASGDHVGVRTYTGAFLFRRSRGQSLQSALLRLACPVPVADERQGEALALLERPGRAPAFATISEGKVSALWITEPE